MSHMAIQTEERSVLHNPDGQSEDMTGLLSSDPHHKHDTTPKQMDINIASAETGTYIVDIENEPSVISDTSSDEPVLLDLPNTCMCSCCHKEIQHDMWWRCTNCINDICEDCVKKGKHGTHQNQLHKFTKLLP